MEHIWCLDLFNCYTKHLTYKDRPKLLFINKQIHSLYTQRFLTQDKEIHCDIKKIMQSPKIVFFSIQCEGVPLYKILIDAAANQGRLKELLEKMQK